MDKTLDVRELGVGKVAGRCSAEEWDTRVNLAACYRLFAYFRMTDLIYNHISARVPGHDEQFLINPYGYRYEEMTASSLVKVDVDGNIIEDATGLGINPGGFTIHSAVHMVRHDIACVMHTHTADGVTVSCQRGGLLPLTQYSMRFYGRIAYHDYEGVYFTDGERKRLQASLGDKEVMLLRNHGLLVAGKSIPEAFDLIYYLERACQIQVRMQSTGVPLVQPGENVAKQVSQMFVRPDREAAQKAWIAMLRMLDSTDPSFRS
jgi:ribulose-5-phosphate 4-epimerase/fuculose-1-phosphate aldolase